MGALEQVWRKRKERKVWKSEVKEGRRDDYEFDVETI